MKNLQNQIEESMISEAKAQKVGIFMLRPMTIDPKDRGYTNPDELLDFDWDEEMVEYFKKHCCIVPALGGFSGNVQDDWTEFGMSDLLRKKVLRPSENAKAKQIIDNEIVKKYLKFEPELIGFRFVSGFDCPAIICFDEDTPMAKKIMRLVDDAL